jgi:hypothetical protein
MPEIFAMQITPIIARAQRSIDPRGREDYLKVGITYIPDRLSKK